MHHIHTETFTGPKATVDWVEAVSGDTARVSLIVREEPAVRYHVFYSYGSCNDGSHDHGEEVFDTLDEAREFAKEVMGRNSADDGGVSIIEGKEVALDLTNPPKSAPANTDS